MGPDNLTDDQLDAAINNLPMTHRVVLEPHPALLPKIGMPEPTPDGAVPPPAPAPIAPTAYNTPATNPTPSPQGSQPEFINPHKAEVNRLEATGSGVSQVHNPFLRTLGRIGDVALSTLAPRIAMLTPGTTAHHNALIAQQEGGLNQDIKQGQEEATTAAQQAEIPLREAETKEANAKADAALHPKPEKPEDVMHLYADAVQDAQSRGLDPNQDPKVKQLADSITSLQKPAKGDEKQTAEDAWLARPENKGKDRADAATWYATLSPQAKSEFKVVTPRAEPGNYTPVTNREGATIGWVDPKSGHFRSASEIPGLAGAMGGTAAIPPKPTMQMRNVAAQASLVHEQIPQTIAEIDALKDQLGPVMGRWNEFMQGKVGAPNPEVAGLRADLLMMSSAVALMHARGRLPENLREEFDKSINAPQQSAENLKATLKHIDDWTSKNMATMGGAGSSNAGQPTTFTEGGSTWNIPAEKVEAFKKAHPNAKAQ